MSAFGRVGFGSTNRQNQLRAQGQMEPFGNQVRQAMQAPQMTAYQTPAAGQSAFGQTAAQSTGSQRGFGQAPDATNDDKIPIYGNDPAGYANKSLRASALRYGTGDLMVAAFDPDSDPVLRPHAQKVFYELLNTQHQLGTHDLDPEFRSNALRNRTGRDKQWLTTEFDKRYTWTVQTPAGPRTVGRFPDGSSRFIDAPGTAQPIPPQSQGTPYGFDNAPLTAGAQLVSSSLNRDNQYKTLDQRYAEQEEQRREAVAKQNLLDASRRDDMAEADRRRAEYNTRIQREQQESAERFAAQKPQMVNAIPGSGNWSDDTWRFLIAGGTGTPSFDVWKDLIFPGKSREQIPYSDQALQELWRRQNSHARGGAVTTDNLYASPYQKYINAVMSTRQ